MLVVSRKQNQSVVFPALGISVKILRVAGKSVRVGVESAQRYSNFSRRTCRPKSVEGWRWRFQRI